MHHMIHYRMRLAALLGGCRHSGLLMQWFLDWSEAMAVVVPAAGVGWGEAEAHGNWRVRQFCRHMIHHRMRLAALLGGCRHHRGLLMQ